MLLVLVLNITEGATRRSVQESDLSDKSRQENHFFFLIFSSSDRLKIAGKYKGRMDIPWASQLLCIQAVSNQYPAISRPPCPTLSISGTPAGLLKQSI